MLKKIIYLALTIVVLNLSNAFAEWETASGRHEFLDNFTKSESCEIAFQKAIRAAAQKSTGRAKNPQLELAFESVPFRTFEYEYTFAPKNRKELDNVHKIIQLFRFHMLPELALGQESAEAMFNLPSQFEIRYMYKDKENVYIPRISRCALNSCNINYTPHEHFTTFKGDGKGASPNIMTMSLSFTEMEVMTKNTIAGGY